MKIFITVVFLSAVALSNINAQTKLIAAKNAKQFLQFLAQSNEKQVIGGFTPTQLKQFLASDDKQSFSGVTPSQFWKFLSEGASGNQKTQSNTKGNKMATPSK